MTLLNKDQRWFQLALLNLLLAGVMGVVLRYAFVAEVPGLHFRNFLFGHSHVAMIGWGFLGLYAFFVKDFVPEEAKGKIYHIIFWTIQILVLGMMISFPLEGYGPFSITFSTLFVIVSYVFAFRFWRDCKGSDTRISWRFARAAVVFLLISTMALWALGLDMALGLGKGLLYYLAVQFFLHFQLNGWFTFGVVALLFRFVEKEEISFSSAKAKWMFRLLVISTFLTYALAVAWSNPYPIVFWANSIGATLQLAALFYFLWLLYDLRYSAFRHLGKWTFFLLTAAIICFALKTLIQGSVVIPYFAVIAYTLRNFIIGFIHLILLGYMTHFFLGYARYTGISNPGNRMTNTGVVIFFMGFAISELLLVGQGFMLWAAQGFIPYYYEILTIGSAFMPIGVGLILIGSSMGQKAVVEVGTSP